MPASQNPEAFSCRQCGHCCRWPGHVMLTDADIAALAAFLELAENRFIESYTRLGPHRDRLCLSMEADAPCLFLGPDNRCKVYPARPQQCRTYPQVWRTPEGCPGFIDHED